MDKERMVRDESMRKAQVDIESINDQLKELGKSAKKLEDEEKRKRYEGVEMKRPVKPVAGLVLNKGKKGEEAERDFDSKV